MEIRVVFIGVVVGYSVLYQTRIWILSEIGLRGQNRFRKGSHGMAAFLLLNFDPVFQEIYCLLLLLSKIEHFGTL